MGRSARLLELAKPATGDWLWLDFGPTLVEGARSMQGWWRRRLDVQGLRAIAVLAVVAFHADLPLPGGYVGVDMFFVISGFVIAGVLQHEWQRTGSISFRRFYLRRFKRLTPALSAMIVVTVALSLALLPPFDRQLAVGRTALGALGFVANWVIAREAGDYFAPDASTNPLLHTWSLSVEEQFYFVFPVLVFLAWKCKSTLSSRLPWAGLFVAALTLTSMASIRGSAVDLLSGTWWIGYYSPLNRAWEFGVGALIALVIPQSAVPRKWLANLAALTGVVLILLALNLITPATPYPGKATLLPVLGTALLIVAGSLGPNIVSRALSATPLTYCGDRSYSIYLWHWPFIAFAAVLWPFSHWTPAAAALVSLFPAWASYRWIESPLRDPIRARRPWFTYVAQWSLLPIMLVTGALVVTSTLLAPLMKDGSIPSAHSARGPAADRAIESEPCASAELRNLLASNGMCLETRPQAPIDVAILGDSHAEQLYPGLAAHLPGKNVALFSFRAPAMFGSPEVLDSALTKILQARPTVIVISRFWAAAPDYEAALESAARRLTAAGVVVFISTDGPAFPFDQFACQYRTAPVISTPRCDMPIELYREDRQRVVPRLEKISSATESHLLESGSYFCNRQTCSMQRDGVVLYADRNHLNREGAYFVVEQWLKHNLQFRDLVRGPTREMS